MAISSSYRRAYIQRVLGTAIRRHEKCMFMYIYSVTTKSMCILCKKDPDNTIAFSEFIVLNYVADAKMCAHMPYANGDRLQRAFNLARESEREKERLHTDLNRSILICQITT